MPYLFCTKCNLAIYHGPETLDDVKCPHCERNLTMKNPRQAPEIEIETTGKQPVLRKVRKQKRQAEEQTKEHARDDTRDDYVHIAPPEPPAEYHWKDLQDEPDQPEPEPEDHHSDDRIDYRPPAQRRAQAGAFLIAFNMISFFCFALGAIVVRSHSKGASIACVSGAICSAAFLALSFTFKKKRRY